MRKRVNLNTMSAAKVRFSQAMHDDIYYMTCVTGLDASKVIRAAMMFGLEEMKVIIGKEGYDRLTHLSVNKDKQTRMKVMGFAEGSECKK